MSQDCAAWTLSMSKSQLDVNYLLGCLKGKEQSFFRTLDGSRHSFTQFFSINCKYHLTTPSFFKNNSPSKASGLNRVYLEIVLVKSCPISLHIVTIAGSSLILFLASIYRSSFLFLNAAAHKWHSVYS